MSEQSYFIFSLNQCLYGISTSYVQEVSSLYELASLPEITHEVTSIIEFRGNTLLVIDISPIFGHPPINYSLTDSLLVLGWETLQIGLIVNEVHDVVNVSLEDVDSDLSQVQALVSDEQRKLVAGVVKKAEEENILILSHPEKWLKHPTVQQLMSVSKFAKVENQAVDEFQPDLSNIAVMQQSNSSANPLSEETTQLSQANDAPKLETTQNLSTSRSLTVVGLSNSLLGIDLDFVQEFIDVRKITPVPCCPRHIAGNMNFRGEILTLVDISRLLNLPPINISETSKVAMLETDDITFGLVVEEIFDVMFFIDSREIMLPPADHYLNSAYLQGIAPYHQRKMSILDLKKLLATSELIVDEAF